MKKNAETVKYLEVGVNWKKRKEMGDYGFFSPRKKKKKKRKKTFFGV